MLVWGRSLTVLVELGDAGGGTAFRLGLIGLIEFFAYSLRNTDLLGEFWIMCHASHEARLGFAFTWQLKPPVRSNDAKIS